MEEGSPIGGNMLRFTLSNPREETEMKLYCAPGVCSTGIHVLLEEIGKPYQLELVNLREGAQFKPPFTGVSHCGALLGCAAEPSARRSSNFTGTVLPALKMLVCAPT